LKKLGKKLRNLRFKWKWEYNLPELVRHSKSSLKREIYSYEHHKKIRGLK
jgi:hypothetical protein